jgi:hypothetical protein
MNESNVDPYFLQLVLSLEASAMQQMGKLQNPITGRTETNLEMAKATIDMLSMIERKSEDNLSEDEDRLLKRILYQLRMNYVDELKSEQSDDEKAGEARKTTDSVASSGLDSDNGND